MKIDRGGKRASPPCLPKKEFFFGAKVLTHPPIVLGVVNPPPPFFLKEKTNNIAGLAKIKAVANKAMCLLASNVVSMYLKIVSNLTEGGE
ncbi:hypothetical protein BKH46_04730 [Helicobacter sp. 12S02634-8]|nr:hypothetical protein BKH46_04730 [Helicobacter sp. 12S02634-8]